MASSFFHGYIRFYCLGLVNPFTMNGYPYSFQYADIINSSTVNTCYLHTYMTNFHRNGIGATGYTCFKYCYILLNGPSEL